MDFGNVNHREIQVRIVNGCSVVAATSFVGVPHNEEALWVTVNESIAADADHAHQECEEHETANEVRALSVLDWSVGHVFWEVSF